jgi:hypothetical protein
MIHNYETLSFGWLEQNKSIPAKFVDVYSQINLATINANGGPHLSTQKRIILTRVGNGVPSDDTSL